MMQKTDGSVSEKQAPSFNLYQQLCSKLVYEVCKESHPRKAKRFNRLQRNGIMNLAYSS